jgi:cell division protein FtsZ
MDNLKTNIKDINHKKNNITIIGIGGAGCNIVGYISKNFKKNRNLNYYGIDTDINSLLNIKNDVNTLLIGNDFLQGNGAGGDTKVAKIAINENIEDIKNILNDTDILITINAGGKGTGTGCTPEIIKIAKQMNKIVYSIIILPSITIDGNEIYTAATNEIIEIKNISACVTTISTDSIFNLNECCTLSDIFMKINVNILDIVKLI